MAGDRHIGRAGFQHRQQRHDHFQAFSLYKAIGESAGARPRSPTHSEARSARQAVRHAVQLTVADAQPLILQRDIFRVALRDRFKTGAEGLPGSGRLSLSDGDLSAAG